MSHFFLSDKISAYYVFGIEKLFKVGESVIVIRRAFPAYFMLCHNDAISKLLCVENSIRNSIILT